MKRQINEKGYVLIGVLLIFSLFTILGVSLTTLSITSVKSSKIEHDNQSAFYIAEAGLNYQLDQIEKEIIDKNITTEEQLAYEIDYLKTIQNPVSKEFERINNLETYATFKLKQLQSAENSYTYEITSEGNIGNQSRTVKQSFTINWHEGNNGKAHLPPFAVFTSGKLSMINGKINGNIGTKNTDKGSISFPSGNATVNGDIYVKDGNESIVDMGNRNIKSAINVLDSKWSIPELPKFPKMPDYPSADQPELILDWNSNNHIVIDRPQHFNKISIQNALPVTFDIGNTDQEIIVDEFQSGGYIKVKGTGKLTIYITHEFSLTGDSKLNKNGNINQLNIFWKGSKPAKHLSFQGDQSIRGSLYAENANLTFSGSGNVKGNLFTGGDKLTITGGSVDNYAQLFFAPHAKVNFTGGGKLNGMVISKEFQISGGGTVNFDQELDNYITGPISSEALGIGDSDPGNEGSSGDSEIPYVSVEKTGALQEVTN